MISWTTSKEDTNLIHAIVLRAKRMEIMTDDQMAATMDITACHANGTPLRLWDLLNAADTDFTHDITGIQAYIDRGTGNLRDCFLPRFVAHQSDSDDEAK